METKVSKQLSQTAPANEKAKEKMSNVEITVGDIKDFSELLEHAKQNGYVSEKKESTKKEQVKYKFDPESVISDIGQIISLSDKQIKEAKYNQADFEKNNQTKKNIVSQYLAARKQYRQISDNNLDTILAAQKMSAKKLMSQQEAELLSKIQLNLNEYKKLNKLTPEQNETREKLIVARSYYWEKAKARLTEEQNWIFKNSVIEVANAYDAKRNASGSLYKELKELKNSPSYNEAFRKNRKQKIENKKTELYNANLDRVKQHKAKMVEINSSLVMLEGKNNKFFNQLKKY